MKRLALIVYIMVGIYFFQEELYAQSTTWERVLNYTDNSVLHKAQQTSDRGYIAVGQNRINNNAKMYLAKFDKFGDSTWVKYFDLSVNDYFSGEWIEETHDKGFIIAGSGGPNSDAYLVKTDSLGSVQWFKTFGGFDIEQGECVKQIFDKGYILLVRTTSVSGTNDIMLVRTDSLGKVVWSKIYGNNIYQEIGYEFQVVNNSELIICGVKRITNQSSNLYLIKANFLGDTIWTKTYTQYAESVAHSIDISNDNGFIIGGTADTTTNNYPKSLVLKTDTSGNIQWQRIYSTGLNEWCRSIRKINHGYVFCGMSDSTLQGYERAIVRTIDESGNVLYENYFRPGSIYTSFRSVELTTDNGLILCGVADFGYSLSYIVRTDSTLRIKTVGINNYNEQVVHNFELFQNYPNPFNSQTVIKFNLNNSGFFRITLFDINGKEVADLVNEFKTKGHYSFFFNPQVYNLTSGIYFYRIESALNNTRISKSSTKLLFGENSGIVCDSGAKVIANNATFTSIDSTKKWNGISLKHLSQDTIKNCIIKNAYSGISIYNKNDNADTEIPYSTEISGCTFVNQTNYVLNCGISVAGSNKVLIMNNTFTSIALTKGFTFGIYAEYCPVDVFNIIGNTINNSGSGMALIGCSPFVAQNTLNGNEYAESGIFVDNVNGKFEYNVINDFYYSYYSFTSSPDLLKNVFNNSYDENIYLSYSSVPNMHPVESEGSTYWFSGDNLITGSPSDAGILFDEDAYPNMNYGFNRIILSNNNYYISGQNPTGSSRHFDVYQNYWGGTPQSIKFNVYGADVNYDPYDNGSPTPRETNDHYLNDIGFGLSDTVFYYQSDNPGMVQELYLDANQKEYSGLFSDAIEIYKEIVSDYKDSSYAASCLSRIFNCYEKKNSSTSEYNSLQSYYSNIYNDTSYSETQRNLAEDFMIKSKVKQNNIEEAISDYNTIYINNMNTAKGVHALINKEILSAGEGDNLSGFENLELRQIRINEILSNIFQKNSNILANINSIPKSLSLSQNYPNPFNPVTKLEFGISNLGFV
ncbi:MAG: T9SS type A sorting domain-containing protein [bacterium]